MSQPTAYRLWHLNSWCVNTINKNKRGSWKYSCGSLSSKTFNMMKFAETTLRQKIVLNKVSYLSKTVYHADKISKFSRDPSIALTSEDSTAAILLLRMVWKWDINEVAPSYITYTAVSRKSARWLVSLYGTYARACAREFRAYLKPLSKGQ